MTIAKADILSFVNGRLRLNEIDIDEDIKLVLADLSDLHILKAEDKSLILSATDLSMSYPASALDDEQAIISIVLYDSSLVRKWPLEYLEGGWIEYCRLMEGLSTASRSEPRLYVCNNRKIYPYPPPDQDFTSSVWYYKKHPETADSIEFNDSWRRAIYFGSCLEVACHKKIPDAIKIWSARYENEKEKQRLMRS